MIEEMLDEWVDAEFRPWRNGIADRSALADDLASAMERDHSIVVLHVHNGEVGIDRRSIIFDDPDNVHLRPLAMRTYLYRDFFQTVVSDFDIRGSATLGIFVEDNNPRSRDLPLFCFQKEDDAPGILIPDIDFMQSNFYADDFDLFTEHRSFDSKMRSAIFVGSTTGMPSHTEETVARLANDRLRAAMFFKDHPDITFSLPNITQFDTLATYEAIVALDFERRHITWREQLDHRYLISMDGNGATCSRMVIGLLSNSTLLKYRSSSRLFYFHGLEPGVHYIPIETDRDVADVVARADSDVAAHRRIAQAGRAFAEAYLSRLGVMTYTAKVLARYIELFGRPPREETDDSLQPMDNYAHVEGIGTRWTPLRGWSGVAGRAIEGFAVMPNARVDSHAFEYAAVTHRDGERTDFVTGGRFCGSLGLNQPIHGLCLRMIGAHAETARFRYRCRFLDGYVSDWHDNGAWIERFAPLTGFQVFVRFGREVAFPL